MNSPVDFPFQADKGRKLYVGGLLESVRKEELTREFDKFGEIQDIWVARNPPGFAFVEFSKAVDAERAVRALDGMNVCGSRIRVEFANSGGGKDGKSRKSMGNSGGSRNGSGMRNGPPRGRPGSPHRGGGGPGLIGAPISLGLGGRRGRSPPPPMMGFLPPQGRGGRGPSPPPGGRRGRSPPPALSGAASRYPYDLPPMYPHPAESGFPYSLPGYPMMPFLPPEELLRTLRGRSPFGRRRSRSPPPNRLYRERSPLPPPRRNDYGMGGSRGRNSPSPPSRGPPRDRSRDRRRSPNRGKPRRGR